MHNAWQLTVITRADQLCTVVLSRLYEDKMQREQRETCPLLKGQRGSEVSTIEDDGPDNFPTRESQAQSYSRPAVFAVFFFPALGGMLFG